MSKRWHTSLLFFLFGLVTLLYLFGVRQQFLTVNIDASLTDQNAYLDAAAGLKSSGYTALTDRNRMPLYPFLLSLLYEPGLSEAAFLGRGKLLNIGLSLLILPALFLVFYRHFSLFTAVILLLIHTFTVYIFKAAYVQADLLFYLLSFLGFYQMCRLLWQPSWRWAILTGILLGLAHLTKASILPGLIIYLFFAALKATAVYWKRSPAKPAQPIFHHLATPLLVALFFLLTIWPYIQNSKNQFGQYFYNVNSTFYIWYDSWEEVEAGTKMHGDREGWPTLPEDELPGPAKYWQEHDLGQIGLRLFEGFLALFITTSRSTGYLKYVALMATVLFSTAIFNRRHTFTIWQRYPYLAAFVFIYTLAYLILYAWYWPISAGNRLVLALFSPLIFTLAFSLFRLFGNQLELPVNQRTTQRVNLGWLLNWAMLALLVVDGYIIFTGQIGTFFGGF